jgi:hypothetical protein
VIALAAWAWALIGVAAFLALGLLAALALGSAGLGGDFARRFVQTASLRRKVHRGVELPDEVPDPSPGAEPRQRPR